MNERKKIVDLFTGVGGLKVAIGNAADRIEEASNSFLDEIAVIPKTLDQEGNGKEESFSAWLDKMTSQIQTHESNLQAATQKYVETIREIRKELLEQRESKGSLAFNVINEMYEKEFVKRKKDVPLKESGIPILESLLLEMQTELDKLKKELQ